MNKPAQWFKRIGLAIVGGIRRFPVTVAGAAAIMVLALIVTHRQDTMAQATLKWFTRGMLTLGLGIPLSVALPLFLERREHKPIALQASLWAALAALMALELFVLLPDLDKAATGIRYAACLLAAVALVPAVPYLLRRPGDERLALKLLLRLLITAVFTAILFGGISLVLMMLEKLLAVKLSRFAYMDTAIACLGLFAPSFLLAGVPAADRDLEAEPYHPLMRVLLGYILFPLLAVYTAIIYAYFVRILLLWSWPSNMLVRMVLWYTIVGVLALYFMRAQIASNRWFRLFDTWYPRLTVLPIALMLAGFFIRTVAYGFTEPRYFVLVAALWVTALTALAIFVKPERRVNVVAPALLAALAVLSVFGPWSAFSVSSASQNGQLDSILRRNGMLTSDGKVAAKSTIPEADKQRIYSILDYFEAHQGLGRVRALPAGAELNALPQTLGFDRPSYVPDNQNRSDYISSGLGDAAVDISGYDILYVSTYNKKPNQIADGLTFTTDDQSVFTIRKNGAILYSKDMKEYAKELEQSYVSGKTYTVEELTRDDETPVVKVRFLINEMTINHIDGQTTYAVSNFYALIKVK